ncbi:hypothetical protein BKA70DRAFT_1369785 [Coprinopsis sp. MPI-PUGE-AT-0042]|nr:hypothetical protein BKA70DRAFT_1369785 [Coprinopsis sp. MPI-PUGE-AT-0042]
MSNHYNSNQQWDQYFPQQQPPLGSDFQFEYPSQQPQQQPQQPQRPHPQAQQPSHPNQYQFGSAPAGPSSQGSTSSLEGALFGNQHSRTSSWSNLSPQISPTGRQGSQGQGVNPQQAYPSVGNYHQFTPPRFPQTGSLQGGLTTSPGGLDGVFGSGTFSSIGEPMPAPSAHKRPRPAPARESQDSDTYHEDHDPDHGGHGDSKDDQKAKPIRACVRCKSLKVKCEVPHEGEPCRRCTNGGHDCKIPGRKIRRVPPKREHLINKIQQQSQEIESLMRQLASATSTKQESPSLVGSPALSDSTKSLFDETQSRQEVPSDATTKKTIDDWISKTRESMQELSSFILSDASVPQSYVAEEDPEDAPESDDEYYQDAHDDPDAFGHGDDRVNWAVEDSDGQPSTHQGGRQIRHRTSASSMGTTKSATGGRKKNDDKPANLPVPAAPFGLFGRMSLQSQNGDEAGAGIANERFFRPSAPEALGNPQTPISGPQVPSILEKGLITPPEAEKLFQIYYSEMNLSVSLLDPILYDAKRTFWRSPFLFTVICAIASRFYSERPDLYLQAMQHAQVAAGNALISGTKNVEMCAAYILMSLYPLPVKRWEQQRSWLYLGLAIRVATDLNLHLPITAKPKNENHAREMLNRTRIWLNCFNLDRSTGSQYGKPPIISNNDYTANHSENWWKSSQLNLSNFDIHICAYNAELRHMSKFIAQIYSDPHHPTGLNKVVDFEAIATQTDDELQKLQTHWLTTLASSGNSNPEARFRTGLLRLAYSYARLIALSYGFQHAFGKNDGLDENPFLQRCLNAASDVVRTVVDEICIPQQRHWWRHGPDAQSVFVTFASAFLIKLLQPKFASYLSREKRVEIRNLVQKVIDLLASPEIAVDNRHGPKLYSKFLKNLLAKPLAQIDPPNTRGVSEPPAPVRRAPKVTKSTSTGESMDTNNMPSSAGAYQTVFNHLTPGKAGSLSPPPAEAIADFNNFRPVCGVDPYAPDEPIMSMFDGNMNNSNPDDTFMEYFQPELPFDPDIIRSFNDLSDPNSWQDISMPAGFNLMTEVQNNLGIAGDFRSMNDQFNGGGNLNFLTGPR